MKIIGYISFLCFMANCGQHSQSLSRTESTTPASQAGEKNLELKLINAVNVGDLQSVVELADQGLNLNIRNNEGLTLIMVAIRAQQFAVIEYLVSKKVDLSLPTQQRNPELDARQFVDQEMQVSVELKEILHRLLNAEPFAAEALGEFVYSGITFKNVDLLRWLLAKGVDPNFVRLSSSGRPQESPLIYLFSLRGVEGDEFEKLSEIFILLVSHPAIDVNLKVRRDTPLSKAKKRLKDESKYQFMVDQLVSMGAED